jgi:hypothetical protein
MNIGAIIAGSFVTASGVACLFLANYYIRFVAIQSLDCVSNWGKPLD